MKKKKDSTREVFSTRINKGLKRQIKLYSVKENIPLYVIVEKLFLLFIWCDEKGKEEKILQEDFDMVLQKEKGKIYEE